MTIEEVEMELMVKRDMAKLKEIMEPEEDFVQDNE